MKDHGQQARASENFAGPVDFETPRPDWPGCFNSTGPAKFSLALACWPWSFISPGSDPSAVVMIPRIHQVNLCRQATP